MTFSGHPDQHFGHLTYSQHGEDLMLLNLCKLIGLEKPTYLDLGAHHPVNISNTKLLYDRGSRGVNVEANPDLWRVFMHERPQDENVCVGVGLAEGKQTFYMYSQSSGRNTFSAEEVKTLEGTLKVRSEVTLPVMTLTQLVEKHCAGTFPDILSCDIEGLDYDVLQSADFAKQGSPSIICVEVRRHDTDKFINLLSTFTGNNPTAFFLYCRMGENLVFVRNDHVSKVF